MRTEIKSAKKEATLQLIPQNYKRSWETTRNNYIPTTGNPKEINKTWEGYNLQWMNY